MPFVKRNEARNPAIASEVQKLFIGRTNELHFFTRHILQPEDPAYNIVSIYGDGGVGKSTLMQRIIEEINSSTYKPYCVIAGVDERHATAFNVLKEFAEQLHLRHEFKRARGEYTDALRRLHDEQETAQDVVMAHASDFAGAAVEGIPVVGPVIREGVKLAARQAIKGYQNNKVRGLVERLEDPINDLTKAFVTELNHLVDAAGNFGSKRHRRILLFFDTFEQIAPEIVPWLLDHFLTSEISSNIVLVISGRTSLENSVPEMRKRWLPYIDNDVMHTISLNSFTEAETRSYLEQRGIVDPASVTKIWHLSHGLPLYLSLLTSSPEREVDPTADVVANFLLWIPERDEIKRRLVLDGALFSRPFNLDDLAAFHYIPEKERAGFYDWLIKQPFIRQGTQDGRYSYHELVEELFCRHLFQRSPIDCYATRTALANYYQHCLEYLQGQGGQDVYRQDEWLALLLALAQQFFFLPDMGSHFSALEWLLQAADVSGQGEEIKRFLRDIAQQPFHGQLSDDAQQCASILLRYLETEPQSEAFIDTANALIEKVEQAALFSASVLAHLYGNRGVALRNTYHHLQALADLNRAITLDPSYAWAYGQRGIVYDRLKQFEEALTDFQRALELNDTYDWVFVARGDVYRRLKNDQLAIDNFNRALALDPDYAQAYAGRGRAYRFLAQYEQSIADFNKAIELDPAMAWAYGRRGELYRILKQYPRAVADFIHAIELEPGYFWAYAQLGEVYRHLKQYEQALEAHTSAIILNPEYAWAYASRGLVYALLSNYRKAIVDYDRAIALNSKYTWAYSQRGKAYKQHKKYSKALEDFDRALALSPNDHWIYSHRGLCFVALHEYQQALADIDRALALNPNYARGYAHRGSVYLWLGDLENALANYQRNCELDPRDIRSRWTCIWLVMCRERDDEQFIKDLQALMLIDPSHAVAYVCRGVIYWLQGDYTRASSELQEAQKLQPSLWDAPFWLGMTQAAQGDAACLHAWKQALKKGMAPVLLAPLHWLEQLQAAMYQQCARPLLERGTTHKKH